MTCLTDLDAQRADSVVTFNELHYHPASGEPEWIELHNQMSIPIDLSGWRLSDGIRYQFPEGSVMEPGARWVISSEPNHHAFSEVEQVFGPFSGNLSNGGETLLLESRHGRVMDEISYDDEGRWPCAPDGSGASLSKRHPHLASADAFNWTWSDRNGGTPGETNFPGEEQTSVSSFSSQEFANLAPSRGERPASLRLSELSGTQGESYFIEIVNTDSQPVELGDYALNGIALRDGSLAPGAYLLLDSTFFESRPEADDLLFLSGPNDSIVDAARMGEANCSFDFQRGLWQTPKQDTPGSTNAFAYHDQIVINEIHYHARPTYSDPNNSIEYQENGLEWIELYNRSSEQVDLSGWSFQDAFEYDFPNGASLGPGQYLVLNDQAFSRSLSNSNDRIHLLDANGNTADYVHYFDDVPWPKGADGDGSTLELVHPFADNGNPASWKASDESEKSMWQNISYRGLATEPEGTNNPIGFHELLIGLLDRGEVLIDDISIVLDPDGVAKELIQNGDFETDALGSTPLNWRILGTHLESQVVYLGGGGKALRLNASSAMDHTYNVASTTLADQHQIDPESTYQISFRAKWLSGSPQLRTGLYFNRLARAHILSQPSSSGTPGQANSTLLHGGPPPSILGVSHSPLVPMEGEPIRISAFVDFPSESSSTTVHYRDQSQWKSVPMSLHSGNEYVAMLPSFKTGAIIQFYVEAISGQQVSALHPPAGERSRALIRIGDRTENSTPSPILRLIMTDDDANSMHSNVDVTSERRLGATVVYGDSEIWYDAGVRLRGSPFGRRSPRVGWNVKFPSDHLFRGAHDTISIDGGRSIPKGDGESFLANGAGVATNELIYYQIAERVGGIPTHFSDLAYIEAPRATDDKHAQLKLARFGDIWKESSYEDGDEGTTFEYEVIYYPSSTIDGDPESSKSVFDETKSVPIRYLGNDKEAYRHNFLIKDNLSRDDFTPIVKLAKAMSEDEDLEAALSEVIDIDNWLRVMAMQALTGTIDTYNQRGLPHNLLLYERPTDQRVMAIPWDVDISFYESPQASIDGGGRNTAFKSFMNIPRHRRSYLGHVIDIAENGFDADYINRWISYFSDRTEAPFAEHFHSWIAARRDNALVQVYSEFPYIPFSITTNGGDDFESPTPTTRLEGTGWVDVSELTVLETGERLDVKWIDERSWQIDLPLQIGKNELSLVASDHQGQISGFDSITILNTSSLESPSSKNLSISELMYHPAQPSAQEIAAGYDDESYFEYIELQNIGVSAIDLSGLRFTEGVEFAFPVEAQLILERGETILIVNNRDAFVVRYGPELPIAGAFVNGKLANGGERIRLEDTSGNAIFDFSYHDDSPWPESADGDGFSLVRTNPYAQADLDEEWAWRASPSSNGSPGQPYRSIFTGDASQDQDGDGLSDLANHAFGGSGPAFAPFLFLDQGSLHLAHRRNLAAPDYTQTVHASIDLKDWKPAALVLESERALGDGTSLLRWRILDFDKTSFYQIQIKISE
ncbi:lamin tail domain-containing protein [Pelagicoccus sp. SDUM812003]|uniref:lamin tail domain-containing protein n=1 Tax=Pelagicoccus sp. SDUM812003 TaxID=3041267 RepID=UPI00280D8FA4|nr:lamin tail domain-containing protein [Pelagicoccus sp. SDUM812003]MDQ8204227.1 lamin tail domain-containing protein [Pelagicoccus sp. SDUM812003]